MTSHYLRYPDVHGDEVAFVLDDDVWLGPLAGGRASRVTTDHEPVRTPRFSPDGASIAWLSYAGGAPDVYVFDRASGRVARLTWWSDPTTRLVGWSDSDHVVVASAHAQYNRRLTWLYEVDADANSTKLAYGPARSLAKSASGKTALITSVGLEAAFWKRYRGGEASRLWLQNDEGWQRLLDDAPAGCYSPGWFGDRLFFSSDLGAGGLTITDPHAQAQLWSVDASGADLRQHTHHGFDEGYVRDPVTDGTTIVYHARGRIYAMDGLDAEPREIEFTVDLPEPAPVMISPTDRLESIVVDKTAAGSFLEWRGSAYYLTHRAGPARALSALPGVRVKQPQPLGDDKAVMATDAEGEDGIEVTDLTGLGDLTRYGVGKLGTVLALAAAPSGDKVAIISHDGRISVLEIPSGEITQVGQSPQGEATGLAWSPDSRYLVWREALAGEGEMGRLTCRDTREQTTFGLTAGRFNDFSPSFSRDGKYLCFLSSRTFDPHYDQYGFDLSFSDSVRPWLVPLSATEPAPFGPSADGWPIAKDDEKDDDKDSDDKSEKKDAPPASVIDPDGFEERMVPFPVTSGTYEDLACVKGGVLWMRDIDVPGVLGTGRAGGDAEHGSDVLEFFSFEGRRVEQIVGKLDSFSVSGNGEYVAVRGKDDVSVQPVDRKIDDDDDYSRVRVDLSRLRREVRPREEWAQMFDENGRLMRDHFWREDMNGVDWSGVLAMYRPLVERVMTHDDLTDVLWECVAELNNSHAYVRAPGPLGDPAKRVGRLGADLSRTPDGEWRLDRIVPGESSDPGAWSPLRQAGVAASAGDVIVAVDGQATGNVTHIGELLQGSVGKVVELTLRSGEGVTRRVAVVPLASEQTLRYHDWVASRRAYVEQKSGGRLGYIHVPDMVATGWAQFARQVDDATRHEGVITDVRANGGGHTSQLILERLARRVVGWDVSRHYANPATYPHQAVRGPLVFVTNQFAGSDGDIVTAAAQEMGLGPVVGERSWGGVVGIDGRFELVDGTGVTQPRYAFWFNEHGWDVENHGVDPDVEVIMTPADWESDDDIQLDAAIAIALRQLEDTPAATPPEMPAPLFE